MDDTRNLSPQALDTVPTTGNARIVLRKYQEDAVKFFLRQRKGLLLDECGLGKTITAVNLGLQTPGKRLLIVPNKAKLWWVRCILQQDPKAHFILTERGGHFYSDEITNDCWLVIHPEGFRKQLPKLRDYLWELAVVDEAHRFRNPKTQLVKSLWEIQANRKVALTGTPVESNPADIWALLHWQYPEQFKSYWNFMDTFVEYTLGYMGARKVQGLRKDMQEKFYEILNIIALRRTKAEVAPELPPKIKTVVPIELDKEQRKLYSRVQTEVELDLSLSGVDHHSTLFINGTLARLQRLLQAACDPLLFGHSMVGAKLEWVYDWLDDNPEEKVVVFTNFRETAMTIAAEVDGSIIIGGRTDTEEQLQRWQSGQTNVLVCTIAAGGESLNLQHADTAIYLDSHWSSTKMQQAEDRIHRIDIKNAKNLIYLVAQRTVDELVQDALTRKFDIQTLVTKFNDSYLRTETT